ncbi:hypothetical protein ElyMa_004057700 [Elysia marginata]|uniref:Uncharacterized protein n=1 Tax=Elysia marginata TaxID=1093978 RepID=A0AAV4G5C8_9GAST|nr:hypothetical protein ElyMa_004057700 [Elysia marginata]
MRPRGLCTEWQGGTTHDCTFSRYQATVEWNNEEADRLANQGQMLDQFDTAIDFASAKNAVRKHVLKTVWAPPNVHESQPTGIRPPPRRDKESGLTRRERVVLAQLRCNEKSPILQQYLNSTGAADSEPRQPGPCAGGMPNRRPVQRLPARKPQRCPVDRPGEGPRGPACLRQAKSKMRKAIMILINFLNIGKNDLGQKGRGLKICLNRKCRRRIYF